MRSGWILFSLFAYGLSACGPAEREGDGGGGSSGGGGGTQPSPAPVTYKLAQSQPVTFGAGEFYGFSFRLPKAGSFRFSASQTTTDTWNVAVFTPAQWVSYQTGSGNQAYAGIHNGVMQVNDSVALPAGDWYLGFRCTNVFQRCMFVFNAEATY
ncbi:MAG: hypothetical protein U1A78_39190 [Polyangia bacterium]